MDVVIAFVVSSAGAYFYGLDFCTIYTFVSIATALYKSWTNYANDKTARR